MIGTPDYDFSFSGLKTAVLYLVQSLGGTDSLTEQQKADIAFEFQAAVTEVLLKKTLRALDEHSAKSLIISGGVSASSHIRQAFQQQLEEHHPGTKLFFPARKHATDNALMIALAGIEQIQTGNGSSEDIKAEGKLSIENT